MTAVSSPLYFFSHSFFYYPSVIPQSPQIQFPPPSPHTAASVTGMVTPRYIFNNLFMRLERLPVDIQIFFALILSNVHLPLDYVYDDDERPPPPPPTLRRKSRTRCLASPFLDLVLVWWWPKWPFVVTSYTSYT